jgi:hypothetical protein
MVKTAGGNLWPVDDMDAEKLKRFKTGEQYEIEIKLSRNPAFHRKVFAFFNFCFAHWKGGHEFQCEHKQFDVFRSQLTALAGFYDSYDKIGGGVRVEAKSISYASMEQDEFEKCYVALTNAAMKHIFEDADELTYNKLISFF